MRSAIVSAAVVLAALTLVGAGVAALLYRQQLADVDAGATRRVRDVVASLQFDSAADLDAALLATDPQIVAVQIVDSSGADVRASSTAPQTAMVPVEVVGSARSGLASTVDPKVRVSGLAAETLDGRYTVLVAAGSRGVKSTVETVVVLLAVLAPFVIAGAASATYVLVHPDRYRCAAAEDRAHRQAPAEAGRRSAIASVEPRVAPRPAA